MWLIRLLSKIKRKHPFPRTPSDNLINISLDHDVKLQQKYAQNFDGTHDVVKKESKIKYRHIVY